MRLLPATPAGEVEPGLFAKIRHGKKIGYIIACRSSLARNSNLARQETLDGACIITLGRCRCVPDLPGGNKIMFLVTKLHRNGAILKGKSKNYFYLKSIA